MRFIITNWRPDSSNECFISDWSAVRIKENGFLRVKGYNYTHLYAEFFSTTTVSSTENLVSSISL